MKRTSKKIPDFFLLSILLLTILAVCSLASTTSQSDFVTNVANHIYEEIMSPNEDYVTSKDDMVNLDIKIYQSEDFIVFVEASSNSSLIKDQQYSVSVDQQISKENISVIWTTMMGNPEPSEDDQLVLADIAITLNCNVVSEQKISFDSNVMEIVAEAIEQNQ